MAKVKAVATANLSPLQRLLLAAAPGGALTRRWVFACLAAGFVIALFGMFTLLQIRANERDPAGMRFADADLGSLPTHSSVTDNPTVGHGETRQYGLFDSSNKDVTVMMVVPPAGQPVGRDFMQEVRWFEPIRSATRAAMGTNYELETRFGIFQAAEIQIDMAARWKDCLAFLSRFETSSIYIKGWYCDGVGAKPNAERLACALDSLVLDKPLESARADAFMHEHMARPSFCAALSRGGQDRDLLRVISSGY
jgi:hypothetical protein